MAETALTYDNRSKQLGIVVKERFVTEHNLQLKATGVLNPLNDTFEFCARLRQFLFTRPARRGTSYYARQDRKRPLLGVGVSYLSGTDDVLCGLSARKQFQLGSSETWLKIKAQGDYNTQTQKVDGVGKVQLSRTVYNFTETQDVRVVVGYRGHVAHDGKYRVAPYGRLQENNWSINTDFKGWIGVSYGL